jgi:hypothetical protein
MLRRPSDEPESRRGREEAEGWKERVVMSSE